MSTDIQKEIETIKREGALNCLKKHYNGLIRNAMSVHESDLIDPPSGKKLKFAIEASREYLNEAEATLDAIIEMEAATK